MSIKNEVDVELWETIKKNYEAENYTGAILDSTFKLTDTIRNKTGLEGDGSSLIGQAFGGDNPKIKLNKLQTDSEKDIQRGMQDILRGIYTAIRNPRSHDAMHDKKTDTDAIIIFINYLLGLIDNSKLSFEEEDFLIRVFDPYYVKTVEYSGLLVQEIPKRQRANIAISTILNRNRGEIYALGFFLSSLFDQLDDTELFRVYKVISDELKITTAEEDVRYFIHICPGKFWGKIEKAVRLRIEYILYEDFSNAVYDANSQKCGHQGSLATWITTEHLQNFSELIKWTRQTIDMLESDDRGLIAYADKYFWNKICMANETEITYPLKNYFNSGLKNGTKNIIDKLKSQIVWEEDHPWWKVFDEELKRYPDIKYEEFPF